MTQSPRAILLDIEGTTSSIAFVADTLFPYARKHLRTWVSTHPDEAGPVVEQVAGDDPIETLLRWIDEDRKETPLKTLQGMIWADGFTAGELKGHVYPDTPEAMRRWKARGLDIHIYSSGSIAAQKLIFGNSVAGDLTPMLSGYFDTTTGHKREAESYAKIADALGLAPEEVLFLTDVQAEAEAARAAGMQALLIDREGDAGEISTLAEVLP